MSFYGTTFNILGINFNISTDRKELFDRQIEHIKQFYNESQTHLTKDEFGIHYIGDKTLYDMYRKEIENSEETVKLLTFKDEYHYKKPEGESNMFMRSDGKYVVVEDSGNIVIYVITF
ncbi:MAG: hypothetical protein A2Y24_01285 [Clostridiales bacterium GWE2_32_10]|nr:MAG: hypothetical protein A2Y24_01285 [Clostridiales bacterium GWE2_32_10]HBY20639.1 hypothetical protein [Clostridiales bacterium]